MRTRLHPRDDHAEGFAQHDGRAEDGCGNPCVRRLLCECQVGAHQGIAGKACGQADRKGVGEERVGGFRGRSGDEPWYHDFGRADQWNGGRDKHQRLRILEMREALSTKRARQHADHCDPDRDLKPAVSEHPKQVARNFAAHQRASFSWWYCASHCRATVAMSKLLITRCRRRCC
ncbi:hypothetical protein D9M72_368460 [compost metagenome]